VLSIEVDLCVRPRVLIIASVLLVVLIIGLVIAFIKGMIDLALRKKARGYFCSQLRRVVFVGRYTAISYLFLLKTQLIALSYQVSLGISFADVLLLENCLCLVLPRQRFRFKLLKIEDLLH